MGHFFSNLINQFNTRTEKKTQVKCRVQNYRTCKGFIAVVFFQKKALEVLNAIFCFRPKIVFQTINRDFKEMLQVFRAWNKCYIKTVIVFFEKNLFSKFEENN